MSLHQGAIFFFFFSFLCLRKRGEERETETGIVTTKLAAGGEGEIRYLASELTTFRLAAFESQREGKDGWFLFLHLFTVCLETFLLLPPLPFPPLVKVWHSAISFLAILSLCLLWSFASC